MKNKTCLNRVIAGFLIFCFFPVVAQKTAPSDIADAAHKAYAQKNYEQALSLYKKLDSLNLEAPELYYDLGNAYFKTGNIPMAILNYERANKLKPNDADILFNLHLANQRIVDKTDTEPAHFLSTLKSKILHLLPEKIWSVLSLILFSLFLVSLALFFSYKTFSRPSTFLIAFVFLLAALSSGLLAYMRTETAKTHDEAILIQPNATGKGSPDEKGTDLFIIHEGTKVSVLRKLSGWSEVRLSNGTTGWLPSDSFITI